MSILAACRRVFQAMVADHRTNLILSPTNGEDRANEQSFFRGQLGLKGTPTSGEDANRGNPAPRLAGRAWAILSLPLPAAGGASRWIRPLPTTPGMP